MSKKNFVIALAATFLVAGTASAQMADMTTETARVFRAAEGPLRHVDGDRGQAVRDFLAEHGHSGRTVDSLVLESDRTARNGRSYVRFSQEISGRKVYGTYVKAAFDRQGDLVHLIDNIVPVRSSPAASRVTAARALDVALRAHHPEITRRPSEIARRGDRVEFAGGVEFHRGPEVREVVVALENGAVERGHLIETWSSDTNLLHHTVVDRNGRIVFSELRSNIDSYNIFPDHPDNSSQTVTSGPGAGNSESPVGWVFSGSQGSQDIAGNNVNAYVDADGNNSSDGSGSTITDGNFLAVSDLGSDPSTSQNKDVAVQNLFYFNNVMHDKLYIHGFDEAAGNFQEDNFGNGGVGSDSVNAEAQDGAGTNNANFSTPSDGSNPRMQMFVWTTTNPRRDGDLDSDIIYHEYGHGLTWRMIGGMSGAMSGAIGEGMSDVLSILMNDDDVVGEYSTNDPVGIRSAAYTNYGRTYGDMGGSSVHFDGEIYAATLWRAKELFDTEGIPIDSLWDYIVDGMNFTPSGPAYEDMRDGILASAAGSGHECTIWEAFAAFGIGVGATGEIKGGGPFGGKVSVTESFDLPVECGGDPGGGCDLGQAGDSCTDGSECCSGNCKGRNGAKTCK